MADQNAGDRFSPHDNIASLEGDLYTVTVELADTITHDGETLDEISLSTIQSSSTDAVERTKWMVTNEWGTEVTDVVEIEVDDTTSEKLTQLVENGDATTTETVRREFAAALTHAPLPAKIRMLVNFPPLLMDDLNDHAQAEVIKVLLAVPDDVGAAIIDDLPPELLSDIDPHLPDDLRVQ